MTLLDAAYQKPPSKTKRYVFLGVLVLLLIGFFIWRNVRFRAEENTVETFLNAIVSGNMQQAYQLWKPTASYSFKDFMDDWGPNGYYAPIKSYRVESSSAPSRSNSVAVRVLLSPYQPFPTNDPAEQSKTRVLTIWVDRKTQSLSFPPPTFSLQLRPALRPALPGSASRSPA